MSLSKKLDAIRKKPQRVRERYLLMSMAVLTPVVLTIWYASFRFETSTKAPFVGSIVKSIKGVFKNPEYEKTFGTGTLEQMSGASTQ